MIFAVVAMHYYVNYAFNYYLLLLLAPVTYYQVQPLRINYLASQLKPYT